MGRCRCFISLTLPVAALLLSACGSGQTAPTSQPTQATSTTTLEVTALEPGVVDAEIVPEISEADIVVAESDSDRIYTYSFPKQLLSQGVEMQLNAVWIETDDALTQRLEWTLTGDESSPSDFEFIASIPKSFAESAESIISDPAPSRIVDPDPILAWITDMAQYSEERIVILAEDIPTASIVDTMAMVVERANHMRAHFHLTMCATEAYDRDPEIREEWAARCALDVMAANQDLFHPTDCGRFKALVDEQGQSGPTWDGFASACGLILGLSHDNTVSAFWGCETGRKWEDFQCRKFLIGGIAGMCSDLEGFDQFACEYDIAAATGEPHACAAVGDFVMQQDCYALVTDDPSYCHKIEDTVSRESCCQGFSDTGMYATCLEGSTAGRNDSSTTTAEPGEQSTTTTNQTTTTEPEGPVPSLGGDIPSVDTEGFFADYHCTTPELEWDVRYSWSGGQLIYGFPPSDEAAAWGHPEEHWSIAFTSMWSPGPWLPLDGSSYLVVDGWAADTNDSPSTVDYETYTDLWFESQPAQTITLFDWDWSVIPYSGGWTEYRDTIDQEGGTRTIEEKRETGYWLTAWYHEPSGLILGTDAIEEVYVDTSNREGFVSQTGIVFEGGCSITATNLDLSG